MREDGLDGRDETGGPVLTVEAIDGVAYLTYGRVAVCRAFSTSALAQEYAEGLREEYAREREATARNLLRQFQEDALDAQEAILRGRR